MGGDNGGAGRSLDKNDNWIIGRGGGRMLEHLINVLT